MQRTKFSHEAKANKIIENIPKMDNLEIKKYKKFNDIGEYYQIITNVYLGYENAFLKFKIDTTTKNNAKLYCKARINDDYQEYVNKYYEDKKMVYPEYNINLESFQDINGEKHLNITFQPTSNETINNLIFKMINIFETITNNINSTNNTTINPVDTVINEVVNQVVNQIIEINNISTNEPVAVANEPVSVAPVANEPVAPVANEPVANAPVANAPVANAPVANEPVVVANEPVVVANEPVVDEPVPVEPVVNEPVAVAKTLVAKEPVANAPVVVEPVYVPVPVCPPPFMPVFNELSPQSLDAERMHIYNLEMHINDLQYDLDIMKKKHELRVKCYNDIAQLYQENWKENSEEEN